MLLADRLLALSVAVFDQAFGAEGRGLSERKREVSDCGEGAGTPFESLVDLTVIMVSSRRIETSDSTDRAQISYSLWLLRSQQMQC